MAMNEIGTGNDSSEKLLKEREPLEKALKVGGSESSYSLTQGPYAALHSIKCPGIIQSVSEQQSSELDGKFPSFCSLNLRLLSL